MSKENVELHNQGYEAWNRRDFDTWLALAAPDIEFSPATLEIEGGHPYRGLEGARSFWRDFHEVIPDMAVDAAEIRDLGDVTLAEVRIGGHGAGSSASVELPVWHVFEWRGGKCVWWGSFRTDAEAVEASQERKK